MRRAAIGLLSLWACALSAIGLLGQLGFRINTSPSVPLGLYRIRPGPVIVGDYVAACPPDSPIFQIAAERQYLGGLGRCPGAVSEIFKVLAAVEGDDVQIDRTGVRINGALWPDSRPLVRDPAGRALPALTLRRTLRHGEVVLMSEHCEDGFDARYFGPIAQEAVQGRALRIHPHAKPIRSMAMIYPDRLLL